MPEPVRKIRMKAENTPFAANGGSSPADHRLILVVTPAGRGKTRLLQEAHKLTGAPLLNVNLELSRRLLDLTERQRALRLSRLLSDIVNAPQNDVILLNNTKAAGLIESMGK